MKKLLVGLLVLGSFSATSASLLTRNNLDKYASCAKNKSMNMECIINEQGLKSELEKLAKEVEYELINSGFTTEGVKGKIKKKIRSLYKLAIELNGKEEAKALKKELKKQLRFVTKLSRKEMDYMNKVHANGKSSREIIVKLQTKNIRSKLGMIVGIK